jgi:hypothetical protein
MRQRKQAHPILVTAVIGCVMVLLGWVIGQMHLPFVLTMLAIVLVGSIAMYGLLRFFGLTY